VLGPLLRAQPLLAEVLGAGACEDSIPAGRGSEQRWLYRSLPRQGKAGQSLGRRTDSRKDAGGERFWGTAAGLQPARHSLRCQLQCHASCALVGQRQRKPSQTGWYRQSHRFTLPVWDAEPGTQGTWARDTLAGGSRARGGPGAIERRESSLS